MLSLIICTKHGSIADSFIKNIDETIGVQYELIVIDNTNNRYSIFEGYNLGIEKANFPFLCFLHDDLHFLTNNWGQTVLNRFSSDQKLGAIGVSGSPYYPAMPGAWWSTGIYTKYIAVADSATNGLQTLYAEYQPVQNNQLPVVLLDGMWLCIRKSIFEHIQFDSNTFKGFHHYDMDICLQIHQLGYKLISVYDVLIRHDSEGTRDNKWLASSLEFQKKWLHHLPISVVELSWTKKFSAEYSALAHYLVTLKRNGISVQGIISTLLNQIFKQKFRWYKVLFIPLFINYTTRFLFKRHKSY
jgi:GT2 family glycosyltransferase